MTQLSWLERVGLVALGRGARLWPAPTSPVSELDYSERIALRRIERRAVVRAAVAGALSALASALVTLRVLEFEQTEPLRYWQWVAGVSAVTALFEVGYLYWDALEAVRQMAKASGVVLYSERALDRDVALALARAALELPTPHQNALGVDPHREARRWQLLLASLVYKAKVAASTFLLKALLRRVLGRFAARAALEFVAVPVTALWNAVVCYRVLREARLRAMGPSLAKELAHWIEGDGTRFRESETAPQLTAWALGSAMVKNQFVHPNWVALLEHLNLPGTLAGDFGDCPAFLRALGVASAPDQTPALRALVAAALLDGRLTRAEREWLTEAFRVAKRPSPVAGVERACRAFVAGDGFEPGHFPNLASPTQTV